MPQLIIQTNVPKSQIPSDFVTKATPVLAKTLGMPEKYCLVSIIPDLNMSLAGSTEPCAFTNLSAVGLLGVEENKRYVKPLYEFLEKELGVKGDRMYITFNDIQSAYAAHDGKLLLEIFGK